MNLEKYTELTGNTVPASQEARYNAAIRRTKSRLETMLGFTLKPKNLYTEKGKVQFEGYIPIEDFTVLLPADEEEGVYKLFPYNEADQYFHVDPFKNVYKVKLVVPTDDHEFITITDLDNVVPEMGRDGIGKYIARHWEWFTWQWYRTWRYRYASTGSRGLQLAVDADWVNCYPDDILYLWVDMIDHEVDPNRLIKSESVDGHSWSKADTSAPEARPENKLLLQRYAGPHSSVVRNPV